MSIIAVATDTIATGVKTTPAHHRAAEGVALPPGNTAVATDNFYAVLNIYSERQIVQNYYFHLKTFPA